MWVTPCFTDSAGNWAAATRPGVTDTVGLPTNWAKCSVVIPWSNVPAAHAQSSCPFERKPEVNEVTSSPQVEEPVFKARLLGLQDSGS